MNKEHLLIRLDIPAYYKALIPSLKINGKAEAMGLCPFHDDHNPSLSINISNGLFNCFACGAKGDVFTFYQKINGMDFKTACEKIAQMQGIKDTSIPKGRRITEYQYKDAEGEPLYIKVRTEPGKDGRSKDFKFKHREGSRWIYNRGCGAVMYNLHEVYKKDYVWVVEGENKVDLLKSWGIVATCLDSGAESPWKDDYLKYFEGKKKVIILPDNDEPGRKYALKLAQALHHRVESLKIVDLPGLGEAEDVIDWVRIEGNNKDSLLEIVDASQEWTPTEVNDLKEKISGVIRLEEVKVEVVKWLWLGRIPLGKLTLIDGDPGLGKSTIVYDIGARVSTGSPMPDGSPGIFGGVVILTAEDGLADTVRPRLEAMGADLTKIVALDFIEYWDDELGTTRIKSPTINDILEVEKTCHLVQAKLVVIDPLMAFLDGKTNSWRNQDIRSALTPLVKMAEKTGVAILVIRHLNKGGESQSIYRGGGSIGIIGAARSALLVAKDPQDDNSRVLAGIKNNLAPLSPSLSFKIESIGNTSRIVWGDVSTHTADGLLAIPVSQEERSALDEAKDFLLEILSDGPVDSRDIQKQAREVGLAKKTLFRAKKDLGIRAKKQGYSPSVWIWFLEGGQDSPKMANINGDHLRGGLTTFEENDLPILEGD